jgi:RNA polymerase sigma factor (sigma-70 family)
VLEGGRIMATGASGMALQHLRELFRTGTVVGLTDGQLLARYAASRDGPAFAALVARHGPMVVATCRAILKHDHDIEDAFQATFLVLAREAGSVRTGDALGGWLHRVAYRVAVRAKSEAEQRRRLETEIAAMDISAATGPGLELDLRSILHEAIDRLPERERLPVVLCDLEGLTYEQAAVRLHWTVPTLCYRLAKARKRLRDRLTRRGVAPVALTVVMASSCESATAAVPASWAHAAVAAATGGPTSAAVAALTHTMIKGMLMTQLKIASVAVLAVTALASVGVIASSGGRPDSPPPVPGVRAVAADPPAAAQMPPTARDNSLPGAEPGSTIEVRGRVVAPDGQPMAGAKVYSYRPDPQGGDLFSASPPSPDAVSGAGGRFRFSIAGPGLQTLQEPPAWSPPTIVALARGFGPAWTSFTTAEEARELTLKLVRDGVPIVGRVIDLEGRPVPGATVRPIGLNASPDEDLSAWETAMAGAKDIHDGAMGKLSKGLELFRWSQDLIVTTGADGRFRLTGIGRERLVSLWITGPTIVTSFVDIHARTRPGPTYRVAVQRDKPEYGTLVFHGATFEHAAAPTRPIEGTVRDKDTGKPLAGVSIRSHRFAGNEISGRDYLRTTTDSVGRYRLVGMPGGAGNRITANPGPTQPYLGAEAEVSAGSSAEPATVDFALKHGVAIRGKVRNKATGERVSAVVEYFVFVDNPHRAEVRRLHGGAVSAQPDGSFELVGLPGRGLIAARAARDQYLVGQGAAGIAGADEQGWFRTDPHLCQPEFTHAIAAVDPAENAGSLTCDLVLDPGKTRPGTVEGPDGKPLAGCVVLNLGPGTMSSSMVTLTSDSFRAIALDPKQSRPLFFRHAERKLAAAVMARGDEDGPLLVHLRPAGTITGRLIDDDDQPRRGVQINAMYSQGRLGPGYYWPFLDPTIGEDGRFRIEGLIPGLAYDLGARVGGSTFLGNFATGLTLQPGETRDLGDVRARAK